MRRRATRVRGTAGAVTACAAACAATLCAGAAAVIMLDDAEVLLVADAALTVAVTVVALVAVHLVREVREQQRSILRHLEAQTVVLRNAARVAAEHHDDAPR